MTKELITCIVCSIANSAALGDDEFVLEAAMKMLVGAHSELNDSDTYDFSLIHVTGKTVTEELQRYIDFLHKQINGVNNNE